MKITGAITRFLEPDTDTDTIIPARFLKRTALDGFEAFAFFESRYDPETVCRPTLGARDFVFEKTVFNPDSPLNHPHSKRAMFLLTWQNFGCGSSREHAVYALQNHRVIIGSAPYGKAAFADIFRDNCRQNLIWTPVISEKDHHRLNRYIEEHIDHEPVVLNMDIDDQTLAVTGRDLVFSFAIPPEHKAYILAGRDPFARAKQEITSSIELIDSWEKKNQPRLADHYIEWKVSDSI